jgi:hypothetical protein
MRCASRVGVLELLERFGVMKKIIMKSRSEKSSLQATEIYFCHSHYTSI